MRGFILGILFTLIALVAGGWWCIKQGYLDFGADQKPSFAEEKITMAAVDVWADRHAGDAKNPLAPTPENITAGAQLYLDHCGGCHGIPSNPDSEFARSFNPPVPQFFKDSPEMSDSQNFYIIRHGIRWTGMPAWNKTLSDTQIWQLAIFVDNVNKLPPAAQKVFGPQPANTPAPMQMPSGMKMNQQNR